MHSNVSVAVGGTVGNLSRWTVRGEDTTIARAADVGRRGTDGGRFCPGPAMGSTCAASPRRGGVDYCAPGATFNVAAMWPNTGACFARPSGWLMHTSRYRLPPPLNT